MDSTSRPPEDRPPSYLALIAGLVGTLALMGGIAVATRSRPAAVIPLGIPAVEAVVEPTTPPPVVVAAVARPAARKAEPPRPIEPDRAAIARAESSVDAAARDRALAEARLVDAEIGLRKAALAATGDASATRALASRVKDPTARIERATNRTTQARWEIKRLQTEVATLASTPRSKPKSLVDQSAVAKPVDGKEFHFEIRGDRVAFIDVEKLTELVKTDVRLRLKLAVPGQAIAGTVGPIGDFSMRYEMGQSLPGSMAELLESRQVSYQLQGWEIVPEHDSRGVDYESARGLGSEFGRVIQRLNPSTASITLWIYPDGFPLYRRLRDDLHARGFLVAARPLPAGMAVRGSPVGSLSAGQ